ncbi:hypothetical protein Tsubulata_023055 [Turnera subulata]|uniref:DUF4283 domain-containing protein n=1 Tax=Turnera subulata TaxID=218843 RepID=A0A9Q0FFB6_9ROSI|nr:hypothetical protein Tsubulata_023055 [Turnera subulata]
MDMVDRTLAWVRIPGLPLMYYDDDLLETISREEGYCKSPLAGSAWITIIDPTSRDPIADRMEQDAPEPSSGEFWMIVCRHRPV